MYIERDDAVWRVMEQIDTETYATAQNVKTDGGFYRPRSRAPRRSELIIQRADLAYLEQTVKVMAAEEKSLANSSDDTGAQSADVPTVRSTAKRRAAAAGRAEKANLRIIGALLDVIRSGIPSELKGKTIGPVPGFESDAKLITALGITYGGYEGFKKRNLEAKFATAKEIFKDT